MRICADLMEAKMRITLTVPDEVDADIAEYAKREGIGKAEAMRRALALIKVANREHAKGRSLGIILDEGNRLTAIGKIIGA
jgi:hypothetical protein